MEAASQILLSVNKSLADMQTRQKNLDTRLVGLREALLGVLSDQNCENCAEALNIVQGIQLGQIQVGSHFAGVTMIEKKNKKRAEANWWAKKTWTTFTRK